MAKVLQKLARQEFGGGEARFERGIPTIQNAGSDQARWK